MWTNQQQFRGFLSRGGVLLVVVVVVAVVVAVVVSSLEPHSDMYEVPRAGRLIHTLPVLEET